MLEPRGAVTTLPRFVELARHVAADANVADIGTDHGQLLAILLERGVPFAIGGDVHARPLAGAAETLARFLAAGRCDLRLGDGLDVVAPGEVDTVSIAGVGGGTVAAILDRGAAVLSGGVQRLVLQPFGRAERARRALRRLGYAVVGERCAVRRGRLMVTIVADRGDPDLGYEGIPEEVGAFVGPWLARSPEACACMLPFFERDLDVLRRTLVRARDRSTEGVAADRLERGITTLERVVAFCRGGSAG